MPLKRRQNYYEMDGRGCSLACCSPCRLILAERPDGLQLGSTSRPETGPDLRHLYRLTTLHAPVCSMYPNTSGIDRRAFPAVPGLEVELLDSILTVLELEL